MLLFFSCFSTLSCTDCTWPEGRPSSSRTPSQHLHSSAAMRPHPDRGFLRSEVLFHYATDAMSHHPIGQIEKPMSNSRSACPSKPVTILRILLTTNATTTSLPCTTKHHSSARHWNGSRSSLHCHSTTPVAPGIDCWSNPQSNASCSSPGIASAQSLHHPLHHSAPHAHPSHSGRRTPSRHKVLHHAQARTFPKVTSLATKPKDATTKAHSTQLPAQQRK